MIQQTAQFMPSIKQAKTRRLFRDLVGPDAASFCARSGPDSARVLAASPIQAEVFVLRLMGGLPEHAGPHSPDPWYLEIAADEDPMELVTRRSRNLLGEPLLVHSTSWRRTRSALVLTFIVVISERRGQERAGVPIHREGLARSAATLPAIAVTGGQVLEHSLRHLAWLLKDDELVRSVLGRDWTRALRGYMPEPFRNFSTTERSAGLEPARVPLP